MPQNTGKGMWRKQTVSFCADSAQIFRKSAARGEPTVEVQWERGQSTRKPTLPQVGFKEETCPISYYGYHTEDPSISWVFLINKMLLGSLERNLRRSACHIPRKRRRARNGSMRLWGLAFRFTQGVKKASAYDYRGDQVYNL